MKIIIEVMSMRSFFIFLIIASAFSCGKDDPVVQPAFLNASVSGSVKDCNAVGLTHTAGILQISAQTSSGDVTFVLSINGYTSGQIGTFNIGPGNFNTALFREGGISYSAGTSSGSGRIQISNSSPNGVQGSFEFTGVSTTGAQKVVTDGKFNAYY